MLRDKFLGVYSTYNTMETLMLGCILLLIGWYVRFRYSRRRMYELADKLPKISKMLPFIGNAHQFAGTTEDILNNLYWVSRKANENDGLISVWLGPIFYICLTNPDYIDTILNNCLEKDTVYKFMRPWLGEGLVSGSVPTWKRHRKTLMPTFNQKILDSFMEVFNIQSGILVKKLEKEIEKEKFDVFEYISPCTLDIVCETAMGVIVNAQEDPDLPYMKHSMSQMDIVYQRMFKIWLQPEMFFLMTPFSYAQRCNLKILKDFTKKVVERKKADFFKRKNEPENVLTNYTDDIPVTKRKAFLDLMIELSESGGHWTDDELREEVDTMTIAANDTSAQIVSFTLVMLGARPRVQEKVLEELHSIYGDTNRPVMKEDLPKMQYMERVIKETLRLFPIAPIVVRRADKEVQIGKHLLPSGTGCVICIIGLHRRKDLWGPDADEFNPDRFLPENQAKRHPYSYIPFSAGPRNCIGKQYAMMSMKVMLTTVLRTYKISADEDIHSIPLKAEVLLRPIGGHLISVEYRNQPENTENI